MRPVSLRGTFLRRALFLALGTAFALLLAGRARAGKTIEALAQHRARVVSEALVRALQGASARERREIVRALDRREDLEVALTGLSGGLVEGAIQGTSAYDLQRWGIVEQGIDRGYAFVATTLPRPRQNIEAVVAVRLVDRGRPARTRALVYVMLAFLALAAVAAFSMSQELREGVVRLADRIRAMAAGPGQVTEVPITSLDELGDLERAFNRLWARHRREQVRFAEAEGVLDQVDRSKSEFLATVSHELRTPLNSILGFTQVLIAGIDGELTVTQLEDVKIVEQSGYHLLALISDILDLSAMESGRIDLQRIPTDVHEIALEVMRSAEGQLRGKPLRLGVVGGPELPLADADPKRLRQILQNLVSNAIKFTDRGEVRVGIALSASGAELEVSIHDTGSGIPAAELQTVFEEYSQLGETVRRRRGTGLGLPICRRLVELHGGSLRVESTVGEGSTFAFTLPVCSEMAREMAREPTPPDEVRHP